MSKGLGRVERAILTVLKDAPELFTGEIAMAVYQVSDVEDWQLVSVRRALCKLTAAGLIHSLGEYWAGLNHELARYQKKWCLQENAAELERKHAAAWAAFCQST